jgi:hypothetical protein
MLPRLGVCGRQPCFENAAPAKQGSPHWQMAKAHTCPRSGCAFQNFIRLCFDHKIMQAAGKVTQNHHKPNVRNIGQGEAHHRK